jgi:uncharacterized protein with HEPN domain
MQRDNEYLLDILNAAKLILNYTQGMTQAAFSGDQKTQDAVQKRIEIIGEAARRLSEAFRNDHPAIPWKSMIGMRNILIHEYDAVLLPDVWQTVTHSIPDLIAKVAPLIPPETPAEPDETAKRDNEP